MKEKRKLRIIRTFEGEQIRTLTTYRRFRKRLIKEGVENYVYSRKQRQYQEGLEIAPKEVRIKKERQKELIERKRRIRVSVVLNLRSYENPYAVSIKATTINPEITEEGLKMVVYEVFRDSEYSKMDFYEKRLGFEAPTELGTHEDIRLNGGQIWITIQERKSPPLNFPYN